MGTRNPGLTVWCWRRGLPCVLIIPGQTTRGDFHVRRHPASFGIALLLLGAAGWGTYLAGRSLWTAHHRGEAERVLARRDFTQARRHLSFCLQARPEDASLHLLAA